MQAGYREYLDICDRFNLPVLKTGAMVVAWTEEDAAKLPSMLAHAYANGVRDVEVISADEVRRREPGLAPSRGALLVPGEYVIDPWNSPLAYITQAVQLGAVLARSTALQGAERVGDHWRLTTSQGDITAMQVVNTAGLYGDHVEAMLLGKASFTIKPRKGQFVVYDKPAAKLANAIILPVPTERTKGVVVTQTIFGNLLVGPTAEEQDSRDDASVDGPTLDMLKQAGERMIPGLKGMPVNAVYAGIRPATEKKEYRVHRDEANGYIAIGGIRSTGLTAALGLAQHVEALIGGASKQGFFYPSEAMGLTWPEMPNLAEHRPRPWSQPNHGEVVCHCEMVTKQEITAALQSDVPARDLPGLKRRTRACMGRCQGFYCSAEVARIANPFFCKPITVEKDAA